MSPVWNKNQKFNSNQNFLGYNNWARIGRLMHNLIFKKNVKVKTSFRLFIYKHVLLRAYKKPSIIYE